MSICSTVRLDICPYIEEKSSTRAYCLSQGPQSQMDEILFYPLYAIEAFIPNLKQKYKAKQTFEDS
jgi:hypothetical protein